MMEGIGVKKSKPAFKEGLTDCCLSTHSQNDLMHANGTVSPSLSLFSFFFLPSPLPLRFPFIHVNIPPSPRPPPPSSLAACSMFVDSLALSLPFPLFPTLVSSFPLSPQSQWHRQQQQQKAPHAHHQKRSYPSASLFLPLRCWFRRPKGVWKKGRKERDGGRKEGCERESFFLSFSATFLPPLFFFLLRGERGAATMIAHWGMAVPPCYRRRGSGQVKPCNNKKSINLQTMRG